MQLLNRASAIQYLQNAKRKADLPPDDEVDGLMSILAMQKNTEYAPLPNTSMWCVTTSQSTILSASASQSLSQPIPRSHSMPDSQLSSQLISRSRVTPAAIPRSYSTPIAEFPCIPRKKSAQSL